MMLPTPNTPAPNTSARKIVKEHPRQRPGEWWALVKITAEPTATAQEVRDAICDNLMIDLYEGEEHPLQSAEVRVDRQFGLHPDEGSDENTVYWP